ncbi:MAG: YbjN domain-containing protein [Actinomycetota bacterium]
MRDDFIYVRIRVPNLYSGWLPVEIEIGERTLRMVAGFSVRPQTNEAEAYRYLLTLNMKAPGFSFGLDAENRICLVGRIPLDDLDARALDAAFGRIVEITESAVRGYLQLSFRRA